MGNFVFETEKIAKFPAELYDLYGVDHAASAAELMAAQTIRPMRCRLGITTRRSARCLQYEDRCCCGFVCCRSTSRFDASPMSGAARPTRALRLGRKIIEQVAVLSRRFGTKIAYDAGRNEGVIELP